MIDDLGSQSDTIGIYETRSIGKWDCLHQFSLDSAEVEDVKFSRDGHHLIVWESPGACSVKIYKIIGGAGRVQAVKEVIAFEPYQSGSAPGVSKLVLTDNKQYIVAGFHD